MNVLTFVDPSPRGEWALKLTAELAGRVVHRVVLLATEDDVRADPGLLDRASAAVGGFEAVVVERKVRPGRPRRAIIEEARENRYEITIFPPAGRNSLLRLLQGSRVRSVLRHIPSSVLVARRPAPKIRRILAAVSASSFGRTTVAAGLELAHGLEASLSVIHVVSNISLPAGAPPGEGGAPDGVEQRIAEVIGDLKGFFRTLKYPEPEVLMREGMVVEEVIHEVDAGAYDLLIIGNHISEQGDLGQDLTDRMVSWCPVPVLVVQPRKIGAAARA